MKFWNWKNEADVRTLIIDGVIAEESWFDDDVTPKMFRDELFSGSGDIELYINSPGGDCIAASQIYTMLMEYTGNVTVKIDGLAASAASVIAMAGTEVLMSPTSMLMIHNPWTMAMGDHNDMQKAIDVLNEVKESIINAYKLKTGMSRAKISRLMEDETWMNVKKAVDLGFADGILEQQTWSLLSPLLLLFHLLQNTSEISLTRSNQSPRLKQNRQALRSRNSKRRFMKNL